MIILRHIYDNIKAPRSFSRYGFVYSALRRTKKSLILMGLVTLAAGVIGLLPPYLGKLLVDEGVMQGHLHNIIYYGLLALAAFLLSFILRAAAEVLYAVASNKFSLNLKGQTLKRLLNLPFAFFNRQQSGYITKLVNEADTIGGLFSPQIFRFIAGFFESIGAIIIIMRISYQIALVQIPFLIFAFVITRWMSNNLRKSSDILLESSAVTAGNLQEVIANVADLKQLNAEKLKTQQTIKQFTNLSRKRVRQSYFTSIGTNALGFFNSAAGIAVMMLVGALIVKGQLTIGDYVALAAYTMKLLVPVQLFGSLSFVFQPVLAAIRRLSGIFEIKTENDLLGIRKVKRLEGKVSFNNVNFGYTPSLPVLDECNFSVSAGQFAVILGKNGSGKSTILKLISGFYPDYDGKLLLDDVELRLYDIATLRARIGIVSQNPLLFTGSLKENIKMAKPSINEDDLNLAMELSGCSYLFKEGLYDVMIYESGSNLSGGQRQAIAIARCIIRKPDLLLFDEATAHLDIDTREILVKSITDSFKGTTKILITHDRELAALADRVFILENRKTTEITGYLDKYPQHKIRF